MHLMHTEEAVVIWEKIDIFSYPHEAHRTLRTVCMHPKLCWCMSLAWTLGIPAAAPRTRITWASFLGLEEPSLKLLRSAKLHRTNSSSISNCRRSKSAIFISRNINYNINSLLLLRVGTHIIYIYIYLSILYLSIGRALHTGSRNENNIGAAKEHLQM